MDRDDPSRRAARTAPTGRSAATQAKDRLRHSFQHQTVRLVRELGAMIGAGPAAAINDTLGFELDRVARTAQTFGLTSIAAAATRAADAVARGDGAAQIAELAATCRRDGLTTRFPPIVVIAPAATMQRLQAELAQISDVVLCFPTLEAARAAGIAERPQALVVPASSAYKLDSEERSYPLFTHGADHDAARRAAIALDAVACLGEHWELRQLLAHARTLASHQLDGTPRVLLDASSEAGVTAALTDAGVDVVARDLTADPARAVAEVTADAVVVPARAGDVVRHLRVHPEVWNTPIIAIGPEPDAARAGADAHLPDAASPLLSALLVERRLRRTGIDPLTGLANRADGLAALDRLILDARRHHTSGVVAIVEIDGPTVARSAPHHGLAARALANTLRTGVRGSDVLARVGGGTFLVALPGAPLAAARRRLADLRQAFLTYGVHDARMVPVGFSAGVSDFDDGTHGLLQRAEDALERVRAQDARGGIG
jgi:diguanylate cyclase (GGDEF)-like protein